MARLSSSYHYACLYMLLLGFSLQLCSQLSVSEPVEFLPGFPGPLPFELETGYVGVDEGEDVQLFYYFVKSERNPKEDPLFLWLTGGPGCSVLSAFFYELGPLMFKEVEYNGSVPELVVNPNSWTKVASILFVDLPVGTGFSYGRTTKASYSIDIQSSHQIDEFLRKWLNNHPELMSNEVYMGGDSYVGITLPYFFLEMSERNEKGIEPKVNLQGYIIGNGGTRPSMESNAAIPFAHRMGLISDELYESLESSCEGNYQVIDPRNKECSEAIQAYFECISGISTNHILEPLCGFAAPKPEDMLDNRRSLIDKYRVSFDPDPHAIPFGCRTYGYMLSYIWTNDESVREALHIHKGSIDRWVRCNYQIKYGTQIWSSYMYHVNLSTKGYRSLIYSGDHDMIVPFFATHAWIKSLNYSIVDDWRPWLADGQVAGYTRTYSNQMTFATVKGGGHTAPEYRPPECYEMFKRWINREPL